MERMEFNQNFHIWKSKRCKRCGKDLQPGDFRRLRLQYTGVCKACEALATYERELRMQEHRAEEAARVRQASMRVY